MSKQPYDQTFALLLLKTGEISAQSAHNAAQLNQAITLLTEIHGRVCAGTDKKTILWDKLLPWVLRLFGPVVQSHVLPWVIAFMTGVPAGFLAIWKAFTRGWFGF